MLHHHATQQQLGPYSTSTLTAYQQAHPTPDQQQSDQHYGKSYQRGQSLSVSI